MRKKQIQEEGQFVSKYPWNLYCNHIRYIFNLFFYVCRNSTLSNIHVHAKITGEKSIEWTSYPCAECLRFLYILENLYLLSHNLDFYHNLALRPIIFMMLHFNSRWHYCHFPKSYVTWHKLSFKRRMTI